MYARYIPPAKGSAGSAKPNRAPEPEPNAETQPEIAAVAAAPTAQVGDAGFTYSRYVPGAAKTSKQKPITNGVNHDGEDAHASSKRKREVAEESVESKRSRRETSREDHTTDLQVGIANDDTKEPKKSKKDKKEKKDGKKKDKKQRSHADDDTADHDAADPNTEHDEGKVRNESDSIHKDDTSRELLPPTEADGGESIEKEVKRQKKPKREKSKKSKQEESAAADEDDDSEIDSRHKSMLERKTKALKLAADYEATKGDEEEEEEPMELHDLEPLPQPAQPIADTAGPSFETLPAWLAAPVRVSQSTRTPFTDLGLLPKAARVLEEKGYKDAFAVQTAAIPLLLPSSKHQPGDLLISAATGSGKTLAYALPIVRDISQGVVTRLRALVVLPTRELVKQAQEVFELCARAFEGGERKRVRIGIAIGSQSLKHEQDTLMGRENRYDLAEYKNLESEAENILGLASGEKDPRLGTWDGQIIDHMSKVDVLLCTPGRLVEHLEQTPGFSLDFVRWLVVDEADKILAQSFQGWLDMVMERFQVNRFGARDFPDVDCTGVRKVVLSATLTRDLSLLSQLGLRRPQLIVLENDGEVQVAEHTLPATLMEHAIRVHDANLKPLYLLDLLKGEHMKPTATGAGEVAAADGASDSGTSSDDSSDTSSEGGSDSDTSSDATSDTSSDSSLAESAPAKLTKTSSIPIALIFTKSNESALRLSRLLAILDPSLSQHISTLTSTTPSQTRRKTLRAFTTSSSPIRLIIASDLVARGIDLPKLDHVVNYDLPPSVAGYVHRVGRTARAGRSGSAWTLVGDDESGWFWGRIAKNFGVRRAEKVGRVRLEERGEEEVQRYEEALEQLGKEALELRRR